MFIFAGRDFGWNDTASTDLKIILNQAAVDAFNQKIDDLNAKRDVLNAKGNEMNAKVDALNAAVDSYNAELERDGRKVNR